MKHIIWAIVILVIGAGAMLQSRYTLVVDSPVVAKVDSLTGDVWIVNAGVWRKVQNSIQEKGEARKTVSSQPTQAK